MTEKRFKVIEDEDFDIEYIKDSQNFNKTISNMDECCNLLNKLHEENQSLKKKLEFFNELNKPYGTIIEENKRLKSFINRLTNDCGEIVLMNGIGYNVKKIFGDLE